MWTKVRTQMSDSTSVVHLVPLPLSLAETRLLKCKRSISARYTQLICRPPCRTEERVEPNAGQSLEPGYVLPHWV